MKPDPAPSPAELVSAHGRAVDEVNRWRGRCIECFARIEDAAGQAIEALIASGRSKSKRVPPLFGQKIEFLRSALTDPGLPAIARKSSKALATLDPILELRNSLVHAPGHVWIDGRPHWLWTYRFHSNGKSALQQSGSIEERDARKIERELSKSARSLCDTLRNLVAALDA